MNLKKELKFINYKEINNILKLYIICDENLFFISYINMLYSILVLI